MAGVQVSVILWTVLLFLLSLQPRKADATIEWPTVYMKQITEEYSERDQLSVAVKIPINSDPKALLDFDSFDKIISAVREKDMNTGPRVVAAKQLVEHAEYRVLDIMDEKDKSQNHEQESLILFTRLSPCAKNCANPNTAATILNFLHDLKQNKWHQLAFVFQKPNLRSDSDQELKVALNNIANEIGHENIFRCYKPEDGDYDCINCFVSKEVVTECTESEETEQGEGESSSAAVKRRSTRNGTRNSPMQVDSGGNSPMQVDSGGNSPMQVDSGGNSPGRRKRRTIRSANINRSRA